MKYNHEVIFCIVNSGFSEAVMDAAREFGARGGTVMRARGTANSEAEKYFHITVQPEKEIVMILVDAKIKDDILHALYKSVGLKTPGQGIAFSMPVDTTSLLTSLAMVTTIRQSKILLSPGALRSQRQRRRLLLFPMTKCLVSMQASRYISPASL